MTALERIKDIERVWIGSRDDAEEPLQFLLRAFRVMREMVKGYHYIHNCTHDPGSPECDEFINRIFELRMKDFVDGGNIQ